MKLTHVLKNNAIRSGLLAGLAAAALCGQAQAAAVELITGGTAANIQAKGSTVTSTVTGALGTLDTKNSLLYSFTVAAPGGSFDFFGSWQNNSNNSGVPDGNLYFGLFSGATSSALTYLDSINTQISGTNSLGSIYQGNLPSRELSAGTYWLAFYGDTTTSNTFKTSKPLTFNCTGCQPGPEPEDLPLPGSAALLALGLLGLGAARRKTS